MLSKQFKVSRDFGPATTARFHHFDFKKSFVFLLGYFHTNAFWFDFVFGDAVFHEDDTYAFSFGSTFESVFTLMRFRRKRSAS